VSHQANAKINPGGAVTELVARAAVGDRDAFAALYNEYQPEVFRFLMTRTRNRHLAEDLTSETFLRALRRIETFTDRPTGGSGFGGWLHVIARNLHADHCKAARTRLEVTVGEVFEPDERLDSAESTALRELETVEATETVAIAMQALTPYQQECVRLRFLEDLSAPETAALMGKGVGAVKTLTFRAVHGMQQALIGKAVAA
jgi:RNA polymerase sigma-70 factor (ECF subfamily)